MCSHSSSFTDDGDPDIVSASSGDNTIAVFKNIDRGIFCEVKEVVDDNAIGARTVVAADLNGDGWLDLASASKVCAVILLLLNTIPPVASSHTSPFFNSQRMTILWHGIQMTVPGILKRRLLSPLEMRVKVHIH